MRPTPDWPIRDLLAHRVRTTPDATAVVTADDGRSLSYRELDALVDDAAETIDDELDQDTGREQSSGGRPRIAITATTTRAFVVGLFATWRRGAQAIPLDADAPDELLERRLDRVEPDLLVGDNFPSGSGQTRIRSLDGFPPQDPDPLGTRAGARGRAAETEESRTWEPEEPALCLFTSGTTGDPKGVLLSHRNLVASAAGSASRLGLDPDERWLDCLPTNHMGGLAPIVRSTCYGTTVVLQPAFDVAETARAMADHVVTGVSLVPTQLRRLLDDGWTPPDSVRFVLLGGAPADAGLLAKSADAGVPVCPTYGTTETASQIATARSGAVSDLHDAVGPPLVVADVTIVDPESGRPVEPGETGELVVDGPIVTPGYLDDDATAAEFGEFGLHTGDLASQDASGRLTIHGRLDDAIQTGGETVHPARVARAIRDIAAVDDVAVVGLPDPEWGERVAALVVPAAGEPVDESGLQEAIGDDLANYEVPKTIETAASLPRTASGTIDRSAVRERLRAGDAN